MADIKKIAEEIVRLSRLETIALAQILAREYGIESMESLKKELPKEVDRVFEMKDVTDVDLARAEKALKQKQKFYVPRKIGKPCKMKPQRRK